MFKENILKWLVLIIIEVDELEIGVEPVLVANLQSKPGKPCLDEWGPLEEWCKSEI